MKKYYLLAAGFLTLLGSCSQDDIVDVNHDGDEIRFMAVANAPTRAAAIHTTANLTEFQVSAVSAGKNYIQNDKFTKNGTSWSGDGTPRYWPEDENQTVDFYAHLGGESAYTWVPGETTIASFNNFKVADDVKAQEDLIYAVTTDQKQQETAVPLNFRHALSQIVFNAKNASQKIYVEIYGVEVYNVQNQGTFTFPSETTAAQVTDDTQTDYEATNKGIGTWSGKTGKTSYKVEFDDSIVVSSDGANLNKLVDVTTGSDVTNAMVLLPQETTAWDPATVGGTAEANTGSYIAVKCKVYNIAKGDGVHADGDELVWGGSDEKGAWLGIPAAFDWDQGKKYIYTLVFGNGGGGHIPGPDPDPDPEFVSIKFNVTVDEFLNGGSQDIEADLKK